MNGWPVVNRNMPTQGVIDALPIDGVSDILNPSTNFQSLVKYYGEVKKKMDQDNTPLENIRATKEQDFARIRSEVEAQTLRSLNK